MKIKDLKPGTKFRSRMNKETTFTMLHEVMYSGKLYGGKRMFLCSTSPNIGNIKLSGELDVEEV